MSASIDQRVVEMRFDNQQFGKGVQSTLSWLDRLKQGLKLDGASKGLDSIQKQANGINLSALQRSVESISSRFTNLGIVGVTALQNITNAAIATGTQMVKSLTIDPVMTGFNEYETKMRSITTILTNTESKGTTLDDVNRALDELNTYADQTIYNFAEMTRNIGTFTAAGVDLDTSVEAIKGISNLAAGSGSSPAQAATAMYQLSQALAAGRVTLQDWNSVVNAGMGGELFQNALKETAKEMGIVVDESESFRESISAAGGGDSWLTSDVLLKTLQKFANDNSLTKAATQVRTFTQLIDTLQESVQSGWAQSWETIIGDSEQAAELFTSLSDTIGGFFGKMSDDRNAVLYGSMTSNWDKMIDKINEAGISTEDFQNKVMEVAQSHGVDVDKMIKDYGSLENAFRKGAISTDILKESVKSLGTSVLDIDGTFKRGDGIGKGSEDVKKLQKALQDAGYELSKFGADGQYGKETEEAVKAFQRAQGIVADGIVGPETITKLQEATASTEDLSGSVDGLINDIEKLSGRELLIDGFATTFQNFGKVLEAIGDAWENVFPKKSVDERADGLYSLIERFHDFAESLEPSAETLDKIERIFTGVFSIVGVGVDLLSALGKGFLDLVSYASPAADGLLSVGAGIGDFVTWVNQAIISTETFDKAISIITSVLGVFISAIGNGIGYIGDFVQYLSENIDPPPVIDILDDVSKAIMEFGEEARNIFSDFRSDSEQTFGAAGSIIQSFINFISDGISKIKEFGREIADAVSPITDQIGAAFSGVNATDVIGTGMLGGVVLLIRKFVKSFQKATSGFEDVVEGVVDVLDSARGAIETWQNTIRANTLLKIAGAVGILAVSLIALSRVDGESLKDGLIGVTVLLLEVVGTLTLLNKFNLGGVTGAATTLVIIAGAVSILAGALEKLSVFQSWDATWPAIVALGSIMAGITASAKILAKNTNSAELLKVSASLIVFSIAVSKMADAMERFSQLGWEDIAKGLVSLGFLLGEITVFINFSKFTELGKAKSTILQLASSMLLLYVAVSKLGSLDFGVLLQGMASVATLITGLTVAVNSMSAVDLTKISGTLLALSVSLIALMAPIEILGHTNIASLAKGLVSVAIALGTLSGALILISKYGSSTSTAGLLALAAALNLMILPIEILGHTPWQVLAVGIGALAVTLAVLGGTAALLAPFGTSLLIVAAAFGVFGVAIAGIGAGIAALSVGLAGLAVTGAAGAAALVGALLGVAATIPVFAKSIASGIIVFASTIAEGTPTLVEAFTSMVLAALHAIQAMVPAIVDTIFILLDNLITNLEKYAPKFADAILNILMGFLDTLEAHLPEFVAKGASLLRTFLDSIFDVFGGYSSDNLFRAISSIGAVVVIFGLLAASASLAKRAIVGAGAMVLVMVGLSAVFVLLASLPIDNVEAISKSLSTAMLALSASMLIISLVPIAGALQGIAGLAVVVAGITAIITALGALNQIPGFTWLMGEGTKVIGMIGNAIGQFAGGIIGGFAEGVSNSFPKIGQNLADFMTNAEPFFSGLNNINADSLTGVKALAEAILVLTAADVLNGLTSWFTGGSSLTDFAEDLKEFGPAFAEYASSVEGIDGASVEASANAAKAMAEFANSIPNSGGLLAKITGENDIVQFAEQLKPFGKAITEYATSVSGLDPEVVTNSATAAQALAELAANLPNTGGLVAFFTGDNSLSTFAEQLTPFGEAMGDYAESIAGLSGDAVTNSANAAKALAELANNLPNTGGLVSFFTGDNDLGTFGDQLSAFGNALSAYATSVSGIDYAGVSSSITQVRRLTEIAKSMAGVDFWVFSEMDSALSQIGGTGVQKFIDAFSVNIGAAESAARELGSNTIAALRTVINNNSATISADATKLATNLVMGMVSTLNAKRAMVMTTFKSILTAMITTGLSYLNSTAVRFSQVANQLMRAFTIAIQNHGTTVRLTVQGVGNQAVNALNGYYSQFYSVGAQMMYGLANGIRNNRSGAINAASSAASAALRAARDALDINSPSKEFEWLGEMSDKGLANGFLKFISYVVSAGRSVGNTAYTTVSEAMTRSMDLLNNGIDYTPTIRPVLDLSAVTSGMSTLDQTIQNGNFGLTAGFRGLNSQLMTNNLAAISQNRTAMINNRTSKDLTNRDVVNAIQTMGDQILTLRSAIASMKVVTDTGALVGQIEAKVDQRLGVIAARKGRGV